MKTIKELNESKVPIVQVDHSLDKYREQPLFQDKVDKANETLRTVGPPKTTTEQRNNSSS